MLAWYQLKFGPGSPFYNEANTFNFEDTKL